MKRIEWSHLDGFDFLEANRTIFWKRIARKPVENFLQPAKMGHGTV